LIVIIEKMRHNKKAAIELSMSTIVIVVLAMVMLTMGIILVKEIFDTSTNAITSIDSGVKSEIQKMFSSEGTKIAIYPTSREITIKKGDSGSGFALSVKNIEKTQKTFSWEVKADSNYNYDTKCPGLNPIEATDWILVNTGSFTLGPGDDLDNVILVKYEIPRSAPPCTIPYNINIKEGNIQYASSSIYLKIK
jgi:hypothetical protein